MFRATINLIGTHGQLYEEEIHVGDSTFTTKRAGR